jgi:hypothetical protein
MSKIVAHPLSMGRRPQPFVSERPKVDLPTEPWHVRNRGRIRVAVEVVLLLLAAFGVIGVWALEARADPVLFGVSSLGAAGCCGVLGQMGREVTP